MIDSVKIGLKDCDVGKRMTKVNRLKKRVWLFERECGESEKKRHEKKKRREGIYTIQSRHLGLEGSSNFPAMVVLSRVRCGELIVIHGAPVFDGSRIGPWARLGLAMRQSDTKRGESNSRKDSNVPEGPESLVSVWPVGASGPLTTDRYHSLAPRIRGNPRLVQKGLRVGSMSIQFIVGPLPFFSPLYGGSLVDQGFDASKLIRNCIYANQLEQPCTSWWTPSKRFEVHGQNRQHWQKTQSLTSETWTTGPMLHQECTCGSGSKWSAMVESWSKPSDPASSGKWLTPPHTIMCDVFKCFY